MQVREQLAFRRRPRHELDARLIPRGDGQAEYELPIIYFGFVMTLSEISTCAERLKLVSPVPDMSDIPGLEDDTTPVDLNECIGRILLLLKVLGNHLKMRFDHNEGFRTNFLMQRGAMLSSGTAGRTSSFAASICPAGETVFSRAVSSHIALVNRSFYEGI